MRQLINALLEYKNTLLYIGLLFLSIIFLNQRSFYHQSVFSNLSLSISSRMNFFNDGIYNYFNLVKINQQLSAENEKLKVLELAQYEGMELKTEVFESFSFKVTKARIIKNSYNKTRNYIIIDKGEADGVKTDMGVITNDGIIGVINQTTEDFSSVLSLLHRDLKINASFRKNGAYGSLSWQSNHPKKMKLDDISTLNPVFIGDTIVTGGMSDYFPYGIPIGKISKVERPEYEGYYDIEVELFSNLTQKEFVYIIENKNLDQIKKLDRDESQ
jgi:rod shape-determining protein MreC